MRNLSSIRKAKKSDRLAIWRLIIKERLNPININWKRFIVAVLMDGRVIGCSQIKQHNDGSHELASLVVHPDYQRQGLARKIMEHQLKSTDMDLYLMCRAEMGSFYEKFGFTKITGEEMPKFFMRVSRMASRVNRSHSGDGLLIMQRLSENSQLN